MESLKGIAECLAANIKRLREERGFTQSELAEKAAISLAFLQGIEGGKKWLSPLTVRQLAAALQISESRLFEYCFEKQIPRFKRPAVSQLKHVPDDIVLALMTTCRHPGWKWEAFRWLITGYEKHRL